jgi:ribosomal protein S18 acetylase RimI-like enzyme/pimeloyl-ACP methyl ester carboxylesterase
LTFETQLLGERPKTVILVHGAGNGPWVFHEWPSAFPGSRVIGPDLLEGLNPRHASMEDYANRVVESSFHAERPLAVVAWSMGGLVAMTVAPRIRPDALVLLEPSPPAETQGFHPDVALASGTFDPEETYGVFPRDIPKRPESARARSERKRGISVPEITCPTLFVSSGEFVEDRGRTLAAHYQGQHMVFAELRHWDLVLDPHVRRFVASVLGEDGSHPTRSQTWRIRAAEERDYEPIAILNVEAYREFKQDLDEESWAAMQSNLTDVATRASESEIVIAEDATSIVGAVAYYPPGGKRSFSLAPSIPPDCSYMGVLAVEPSHRHQGIGKGLTLECVQRARRDGSSAIWLATSDLMKEARTLYQGMGFAMQSDVPRYGRCYYCFSLALTPQA